MDRETVIESLLAWGHWSRTPDDQVLGFKPRTGSAEGGFLPEAGDVFQPPEPSAATIPDHEALAIEEAVLSSGRAFSKLLTAVFVARIPPSVACRKVGLEGDPRCRLNEAIRAVADCLAGQRRRAA